MGMFAGAAGMAALLLASPCGAKGGTQAEPEEGPPVPAYAAADPERWRQFRQAHPGDMSYDEQKRLFTDWRPQPAGDGPAEANPEDAPAVTPAAGPSPAPGRAGPDAPRAELEVPPALSGDGESPAADPAAPPPAQDRRRARARAQDMGKALEQNPPPEEEQAGGARPRAPGSQKPAQTPAQTGPTDARPGAPPQAAAPKPDRAANPETPEDLRLAAASFKEPFRAMGLSVAPASDHTVAVVHADGRPATSPEVARLKERIRREPEALRQYPAMFTAISRRDYQGLKDSYAASAQPGAEFRDVGLSASGRDFQWSRSCDRVSGSCNEDARGSYQKGALVDPADLARISKRLTELSRQRGAAAAPAPHGIGAASAVSGLLARLAGAFGKGPDAPRDAGRGMPVPDAGAGRRMPRPDGGAGAPAAAGVRGPSAQDDGPAVTEAGASVQTAPPPAAPAAPGPDRGIPIWPGISAFGLVLIGLAFWKRREE